jgi:uncharacterized protein YfdQ (DUF2303 family)
MDESAIQLIQTTALSAAGAIDGRLPPHMVALPQTFKLVDLEQFLEHRTRYRGQFATASLADFATYVKAKSPAPGTAEGFVDADRLSAKVFFNLREAENLPGHGDWNATLALRPTAAYTALCGIEGKQLTQRQLIDWLEDWNPNIVMVIDDAGASMSLSAAVQAFRKLTIAARKDSTHTQGDRSAARTAMEEIEAKAQGAFPDRIRFACVPYLGLSDRTFELRVGVLTDHDDPRIVLRSVQKEAQVEAIAQEFKTVLEREIGSSASLTVGAFAP